MTTITAGLPRQHEEPTTVSDPWIVTRMAFTLVNNVDTLTVDKWSQTKQAYHPTDH